MMKLIICSIGLLLLISFTSGYDTDMDELGDKSLELELRSILNHLSDNSNEDEERSILSGTVDLRLKHIFLTLLLFQT
ncbi:unnamed protein product [Didymodactylos carnosus]|uniref:Uncharacterized protein n=1 Tax=Didymodactylos carnosus TaxID=1234261 RepID=A0A814DC46_9BILA|nr:unnamed protein product [Didymodactylos carnosus]CAF1144918.1 unnamed protein product [Didymodactylos carnosus]CAF3729173.1 unnamed protein product [Didymodactylos carnosus]CAF3945259.1 unnamed protein product [Didymodactylos carnosus]